MDLLAIFHPELTEVGHTVTKRRRTFSNTTWARRTITKRWSRRSSRRTLLVPPPSHLFICLHLSSKRIVRSYLCEYTYAPNSTAFWFEESHGDPPPWRRRAAASSRSSTLLVTELSPHLFLYERFTGTGEDPCGVPLAQAGPHGLPSATCGTRRRSGQPAVRLDERWTATPTRTATGRSGAHRRLAAGSKISVPGTSALTGRQTAYSPRTRPHLDVVSLRKADRSRPACSFTTHPSQQSSSTTLLYGQAIYPERATRPAPKSAGSASLPPKPKPARQDAHDDLFAPASLPRRTVYDAPLPTPRRRSRPPVMTTSLEDSSLFQDHLVRPRAGSASMSCNLERPD